MSQHRCCFKRYLSNKGTRITSFKILEFDDAYIELIELFPCNLKIELHKREGALIREMDCVNKNIAGQTNGEYHKIYAIKNPDLIKKIAKDYRDRNMEKLRLRSQLYREQNRSEVNKKKRESWSKNKEAHKTDYQKNINKLKQKITCECGRAVRKGDISHHRKSKIHARLLL
tara:strand:- start:23 stop:538 length:516 start_codon:yes stop_codon:yes gene_type:complete